MTDIKITEITNQTESLSGIDFFQGAFFYVDKPYEWTSYNVVGKIKTLLKYKLGIKKIKIGHAGTLDPLATGLLIVCVGKATKLSTGLIGKDKKYQAEICFGAQTPSYDLETKVEAGLPYEHITEEKIDEVLDSFKGKSMQRPPDFSAKRINGKRAYDLARAGKEVDIKEVPIEIFDINKVDYTAPVLTFDVHCSKGTYIRSLAHDIGLKCNSGAYLKNLIRTQIADISIEKAISIDKIEKMFNEL